MKFPVSIMKIDDKIFLFQAEITPEFKKKINNIRGDNYYIQSIGNPDIGGNVIYLNGTENQYNYKIMYCHYSKPLYDGFLEAIEFYKQELGYDK